MKWFLILWAIPLCLLGSWYGLSYHDINFGYRILSRDLHDLVFMIYGDILGMPPEDVPGLALKAILLDTVLVIGIVVLRYRWRQIRDGVVRLFGKAEPAIVLRADQPAE